MDGDPADDACGFIEFWQTSGSIIKVISDLIEYSYSRSHAQCGNEKYVRIAALRRIIGRMKSISYDENARNMNKNLDEFYNEAFL